MQWLEIFSGGIQGFALIILILDVLIWSVALVAVANGKFHDSSTKLCWFFIILFLNIIGILLFIFWGRKEIAWPERK
ncbi:MAG: PLDc N-terminal domain-containing protein [Sphingobacteriales bacterium]|nr:PLDc N-terminal domain-containing protein [Sphingobacteriales bacterium]